MVIHDSTEPMAYYDQREKQRFEKEKPETVNQHEPGSKATTRKGSRQRTARITVAWRQQIATAVAR